MTDTALLGGASDLRGDRDEQLHHPLVTTVPFGHLLQPEAPIRAQTRGERVDRLVHPPGPDEHLSKGPPRGARVALQARRTRQPQCLFDTAPTQQNVGAQPHRRLPPSGGERLHHLRADFM
ncbi:hypothetical protein ACFV0O_34375 [Kitasatospora sp. NPDC059577]|uniref:hypothetical protein n=1 Tax=Kitasatospora sp. NPDC059577 TaxID=3346873 RepID=UPI00367A7D70